MTHKSYGYVSKKELFTTLMAEPIIIHVNLKIYLPIPTSSVCRVCVLGYEHMKLVRPNAKQVRCL